MRSLLLRDWKLYRGTLILPLSFCLLWALIPYLFLANEKGPAPIDLAAAALGSAVAMASLRIHGIQLLEVSNGTLSDLLALPVSRPQILCLRLMETALLTLALMTAILAEGALILHVGSGSMAGLLPTQPVRTLLGLGWQFCFCLLLPMPFLLKWGSRGINGLLLALVVGFLAIGKIPRERGFQSLSAAWTWFGDHPWAQFAALLFFGTLAIASSLRMLQRQEA